jgi:hypothetical protein
MVETEFRDPNRIKLLTTLKETLPNDQSPTGWAYLWLSDIDKLEKLVAVPQSSRGRLHWTGLRVVER